MGFYMRAVLRDWHDPPFDEVASYVEEHSPFRPQPMGDRGWAEFEALNQNATTVLAADLTVGDAVREELDELEEFLDDLDGTQSAREAVRSHLREATAVVGMQVLPSVYEESVAAANTVIAYLEQRPGVLTQIDARTRSCTSQPEPSSVTLRRRTTVTEMWNSDSRAADRVGLKLAVASASMR